jgi:hypothetical protein
MVYLALGFVAVMVTVLVLICAALCRGRFQLKSNPDEEKVTFILMHKQKQSSEDEKMGAPNPNDSTAP